MKKWKVPKWMKHYVPFIVNTGGNDIEGMVNGNADPLINLPLSTLQACVKSQVILLQILHEHGLLSKQNVMLIIAEFVDDCEIASNGERNVKSYLGECWPDLFVTYKNAKKVMKGKV